MHEVEKEKGKKKTHIHTGCGERRRILRESRTAREKSHNHEKEEGQRWHRYIHV